MRNVEYRLCVCTLGESCGMLFFSVQIILCFLFEPLVCGHCHLKEIFNNCFIYSLQCTVYHICNSPLWISPSCSKRDLSRRMAFSLSCEVSVARFRLQRKLDSLCALSVRLFTSAPKYQIKPFKSNYTHNYSDMWLICAFQNTEWLNAQYTKKYRLIYQCLLTL